MGGASARRCYQAATSSHSVLRCGPPGRGLIDQPESDALANRNRSAAKCPTLTRSGHRASILSDWSPAGSGRYFFIIIVIRHETTAAARWALLLFVRTLFNDAITVALWTGFRLCLPG